MRQRPNEDHVNAALDLKPSEFYINVSHGSHYTLVFNHPVPHIIILQLSKVWNLLLKNYVPLDLKENADKEQNV